MNLTKEQWLAINQNFLNAELEVVKAKLLVYLNSIEHEKSIDDNIQLLEKAKNKLDQIERELTIQPRLKTIVELFQLTPFEKNVLMLGVGIELDNKIGKLLDKINGNSGQYLPTFGLILSLFPDAHWTALSPEGHLRYWQLIDLHKGQTLTNSTFVINELILNYLIGIGQMDSKLIPYLNPLALNNSLVPSHQKIANQITRYISNSSPKEIPPIIQLEGQSTADQKNIITNIFNQFELSSYSLSASLIPNNFQDLTNLLLLWNKMSILHQYVLFLDGKQLDTADKTKLSHVQYFLEKVKGFLVIRSDYQFKNLSREVLTIKVEKPLEEEQQKLWEKQFGETKEILESDIGELVTQFNLDNHSINHLAQLAMLNFKSNGASSNGTSLKEKLWDTCSEYTRPDLSSLAKRIEPIATWDALVLPQIQKQSLKEICIHVQQRQKVYNEWGFRKKSNRGLGISALFAGESGTGKTMAAEVLANELKLDLFKIDLSQVVNKYIGETEKNLKKIFDAAENSGAILLFDEADALFGKRSDVKDSHDRYSNIEVSYLLQKMESYRGLAILTTNMKKALDKAFLRRIRFVVQFPFPDAQIRGEIWKKVFPKLTPTKDLNIRKLAKLNVAGGNIRNIALNACFAAANKNEPVTMYDIHNAAKKEYVKLEKHMSPAESLI